MSCLLKLARKNNCFETKKTSFLPVFFCFWGQRLQCGLNGLVNSIKNKTDFKIRQYAVYRKKYKKELEDIWKKQIELNEDLMNINSDQETLIKLSTVLYPTQTKANKPKFNEIKSNTLLHLISEDIIYYQRELKSQKSLRSECQYEKHKGIDGEMYGVKCAPKSSPEFQEFRIWQDIHNIKILQRNAIVDNYSKVDIDVTNYFIDDNIKEKLFELFDTAMEISQQNIFDLINKSKAGSKLKNETHRINMFFNADKRLFGNETKEYFRKIFRKKECNFEIKGELILSDRDKFTKLWNISYSISLNDDEKSKQAIYKALTLKENKREKEKIIAFNLPENVTQLIASAPDIQKTKKYVTYSSKAIYKLLPLMRCGKYYDETKITENVKERAKKINTRLESINRMMNRICEIADDDVQKQLLKSFINKNDLLKGLNTYQACYIVYDRYSERIDDKKYSLPTEFNIMKELPNNSLRNPVVEQVIREALFLVKDVWQKYGQPDEIHIEMGRDLKKNAMERENATKISNRNYEEKQRIKKLLYELLNDGFEQYENLGNDITQSKIVRAKFEVTPNPNSPTDIDKFRIWKDTSGLKDIDFERKIRDEKIPKNQEIKKYTLWLSQKCVSPYTGRIIPLSKLFDQSNYEIEHVLPKSKIKNDSFDNLVIAEWGVNKAKGNELGAKFIYGKNGKCVYGDKEYQLLDYASYVEHCKRTFRGKKLQNLLATEIPDDFISRQINDTRYITKKISELLYPVAKDKKSGIVFTIGSITSELKREWGLQKEWKKLIKPRFERLEKLNDAKYIIQNQKDKNDIDFYIPENPNLDTKRIDHRHHALDAIIIAATTREHIRYLNTLNAADTDEEFKKAKLTLVNGKIREWRLPWDFFTKEAKEKLEQTVVTFKSFNKIIDKPKNIYTKYQPVLNSNGDSLFRDGKKTIPIFEKKAVKQIKPLNGKQWTSVRQSLFKEPQGLIYIKEVISKSFRTPKEMLNIVNLQMKRMSAQNTPAQKNTDYIYDQDIREIVKQIIELSSGNIEAIEKYLKKFKPKDINGEPIHTVNVAIFKEYAAKRVKLGNDFDHKKIDKLPYSEKSRIPIELHSHLLEYEKKKLEEETYNFKTKNIELTKAQENLIKEAQAEAFSDEGLEALDKKLGMKIRMVTIKEEVGKKISLKNKLVEADGNPYFVMYENIETKERRGFCSLSSFDVIRQFKSGQPIAEEKEGFKTLLLQTNDLVYVPTKAELEKIKQGAPDRDAIDWNDQKHITERIYRVNDFSKTDIYFKPHRFSKAIASKELHTSFDDKCTRLIITPQKDNEGNNITEEDRMIKEICIKLKVDRLGNIIKSEGQKT